MYIIVVRDKIKTFAATSIGQKSTSTIHQGLIQALIHMQTTQHAASMRGERHSYSVLLRTYSMYWRTSYSPQAHTTMFQTCREALGLQVHACFQQGLQAHELRQLMRCVPPEAQNKILNGKPTCMHTLTLLARLALVSASASPGVSFHSTCAGRAENASAIACTCTGAAPPSSMKTGEASEPFACMIKALVEALACITSSGH